jgi:hypothetical protein
VIVTPETVLRWQRRRFREHWTRLSARPPAGRPPVSRQIRALVVRAHANPLWGAPRIHGELQKLGIEVAERTVSRLPKAAHPAVPALADVPRQPRPGPGLHRFLHGPHRGLAGAFRPRRARSPSPAYRPLQRDGAPHGALDGSADRGRFPERHRAVLPPSRSRPRLQRALPAPSAGHAQRSYYDLPHEQSLDRPPWCDSDAFQRKRELLKASRRWSRGSPATTPDGAPGSRCARPSPARA